MLELTRTSSTPRVVVYTPIKLGDVSEEKEVISPTKRSSTLPSPKLSPNTNNSNGTSFPGPTFPRQRSRTSTLISTYTPLQTVMSEEPELAPSSIASSSSYPTPRGLDTLIGRKASRSISGGSGRPPPILGKRTVSYTQSGGMSSPKIGSSGLLSVGDEVEGSSGSGSGNGSGSGSVRAGLKRRISTPNIKRFQQDLPVPAEEESGGTSREDVKGKGKAVEGSRGRSTSTSFVLPSGISGGDLQSRSAPVRPPSPYLASHEAGSSTTTWGGIYITPASPDEGYIPPSLPVEKGWKGQSMLSRVLNLGELGVSKVTKWVNPRRRARMDDNVRLVRRGSEDSEKGLEYSETEADGTISVSTTRTSEDSLLYPGGRYWGLWKNGVEEKEESEGGYFSLPPTPPDERFETTNREFENELKRSNLVLDSTLPTPALSNVSLSRGGSKLRKKRRIEEDVQTGSEKGGWWMMVYNVCAGWRSGTAGGGKTVEVIKDLGWTVVMLVGLFVITAGTALWLIRGMPVTTLKHLPTSTTDLQLLSAEIRSYMSGSNSGYWHTIGVLTFVGCWKHAWSVPGAVVLNILVGSLLDPMPALGLLTIITASGSSFAYLLSRPLAPLIAVLFPKPLALVQAALAPESVPTPFSPTTASTTTVTPINLSSDPTSQTLGGPTAKSTIWHRLLIMRAMGFVPWSGMNVACGVVGVDWRVFWLTTAAGSASWSYVTASVGNILSRLAVPSTAIAAASLEQDAGEVVNGESLTSLLRDPVLIAKLVFLSLLTLVPVLLKRRKPTVTTNEVEMRVVHPAVLAVRVEGDYGGAAAPMSPLSQSTAKFTPVPAVFDLLSFGRTLGRQWGGVVIGGLRGMKRLLRG